MIIICASMKINFSNSIGLLLILDSDRGKDCIDFTIVKFLVGTFRGQKQKIPRNILNNY